MLGILKNAVHVTLLCVTTPALASDIQLDWGSVEIGFFEEDHDGITLDGVALYVPSSRVATKEDFFHVLPSFCELRLERLIKHAKEVSDLDKFDLLKFQMDYYGPKLGKAETYLAVSVTLGIEGNECLLPEGEWH